MGNQVQIGKAKLGHGWRADSQSFVETSRTQHGWINELWSVCGSDDEDGTT